MSRRGASAYGVERDRLAPSVGRLFYGLDPAQIYVGDALDVVHQLVDIDIVSSFSLAHHFILAHNSNRAAELVRAMEDRTNLGFFFEMGHGGEAWYRGGPLSSWSNAFIEQWLAAVAQRSSVIALGTDGDGFGRNTGQFGRQLFAVWK
jgi:hypothetical protein